MLNVPPPPPVVSRLLKQTTSLEGRDGALLPGVQGLAMENRVWVVLASSCFSPSLTFPLLSFLNLHSGQEGRASWEESTKQAKSGLLTPSQPSLPPTPRWLCVPPLGDSGLVVLTKLWT